MSILNIDCSRDPTRDLYNEEKCAWKLPNELWENLKKFYPNNKLHLVERLLDKAVMDMRAMDLWGEGIDYRKLLSYAEDLRKLAE